MMKVLQMYNKSINIGFKKNGFSLVEVVVAITIIGVIGVITSTILTRSYRAGNQSDTVSKLKQNGDQAVNLMAETIRSSEGVICYGVDPNDLNRNTAIVVRTLAGQYVKFMFVDPVPAEGSPVTANGYIIKQENLNPTDYAGFCTTDLASPTKFFITNNEASTGVSISEGRFLRIAGNTGKDTITISFTVNPTLTTGGTGASEFVDVRTTVQIR